LRARLGVGELVSYLEPGGGEVAGLVVEIRRRDCRVLDLDADRSYWLPVAHLRRGARSVRKGSATSLLSSLVQHLEGSEIEVERDAAGVVRAQIACAEIDAGRIDAIRRYFGDGFRSLTVLPGGLAKVWLAVEFVPSSPAPASAHGETS
jgi:hypothetical protein